MSFCNSNFLQGTSRRTMNKEYEAFLKAYDNIDVRSLSDDELKRYADLSNNGLLEAQNEIYKRGL